MATTFITSLPPHGYTLTSRLDTIQARTDRQKVTVTVIRDPEGEIDEFFSTTLYPFAGIVELSALGSLIEQRFRLLGISHDMISVIIDGVALDFIALYCAYNLPDEFSPLTCFWTTSPTAIVHPHSAISLSHHYTGSDTYTVKVVGHTTDGHIASLSRTFSRRPQSDTVSFSVDEILSFALNQSEIETADLLASVAYFTISYGEIQKIFYLAHHPFFLTFRFRNIFNTPEYIDIVGTLKRKTAVERSLAICSGHSRQYNRVINRTYELTTAPLTDDQAKAIEQLIESHSIQLCGTPSDSDILITDHTCEVDNSDDTLISVKFTFRFASPRPTPFASDMTALMPSATHIFSEEFTAEFA